MLSGMYNVLEITPNTNDTIIQISAFLDARFAPSMSPAKYLLLTFEE